MHRLTRGWVIAMAMPASRIQKFECARAGILAVVRSNVAQERPYTGLTEIRSGEVAEDLASYLADSEQVPKQAPPSNDSVAISIVLVQRWCAAAGTAVVW